MKDKNKLRRKSSDRRQRRVRKKIRGNSLNPRLCVYKSLNYTYAQLVDDEESVVIAGVSSLTPEVRMAVKKEDKSPAINLALHIIRLGGQALVFTGTRRDAVSKSKKASKDSERA